MIKTTWNALSVVEKHAYLKGAQEAYIEIEDYIYEIINLDDEPTEKIRLIQGYVEGMRRGIENEIVRN